MARLSLSESEVKQITNRIMNCKLTETSHLFMRYPNKTIGEAALMFSPEYSQEAKKRPGLVLLSVILAAHRNYTKQVEPQLNRIRKLPFSSFKDLRNELASINRFVNFCGMNEEHKYHILRQLLDEIDKLKVKTGIHDDYSIVNHWAQKADYMNASSEIIGRISGIGIATFQHLRMNFGVDTVKPDQRVTEVLNREYALKSTNPIECIAAVESIAKIVGLRAIELDQILVNYGSGYYAKSEAVRSEKTQENNNSEECIFMINKQENINPGFFRSENYIKANDHMKSEINALINKFVDRGFDIWPEWRNGKSKVFTLKTDNRVKKSGFDNVATVHCMFGKLKVEIYYGAYDKRYYYFSGMSENSELFEEAKYNYQHNLGKMLKM
jgi:hypothetical protein